MNVSKHISLKEAVASNTAKRLGIDNYPPSDVLDKMRVTAENVFEPLREHFGEPIYISSFYRCEALNKAIGGSSKSQHCHGEAIDIDDIYSRAKNSDFFDFIKYNVDFDQLIWEFGDDNNPDWVHVSYKGKENRKRILKAVKQDGKTVYIDITNE